MKHLVEDVKEILEEHNIEVISVNFGDRNHAEVMLVRERDKDE